MITLNINVITTQNYYSQTLILSCTKLKLGVYKDVYKDLSNDKEMFGFSNYSTKSKCYNQSSKLVVGKMKDETARVAMEEFVGLKRKTYLYLEDDGSEHEKAKGGNKNAFAIISRNQYKNVLLNHKRLKTFNE